MHTATQRTQHALIRKANKQLLLGLSTQDERSRYELHHECPSVCPQVPIHPPLGGGGSCLIYIGQFYEILSRKSKFDEISSKISGSQNEDKYIYDGNSYTKEFYHNNNQLLRWHCNIQPTGSFTFKQYLCEQDTMLLYT